MCLYKFMIFLFSVPGPPVVILFPEVRTTSVRLIWQPPSQPNGIILGTRVCLLFVCLSVHAFLSSGVYTYMLVFRMTSFYHQEMKHP